MKRGQIFFSLLSFAIAQVVLISFLVYDEGRKRDAYLAESVARLGVEVAATDDYFHDLSLILFAEVFNKEPVPAMMRNAWHGDAEERRKTRDALYRLMLPTFRRLEATHYRQVHFHLPDGASFLRMHKPEKFGDNILAARDTVRVALAEKRHVRAFETGKLFHAFRHVSPILHDGELVGSIETSVPFYAFARLMISSFAKDYKFMLREEIIEEKLFDWAKNYYAPALLAPGFVHEKADLDLLHGDEHPGHIPVGLEKQIEFAIKKKAAPLLPLYKPFALPAMVGGKNYIVAFQPIKNLKGDPAGYLYSFAADETLAAFRRGTLLTYGLVTSLLLLLLVLAHVASQKLLAQYRFQQTLIDSVPTPVYFKDALRRYLGGNRPFAKLFGLTPAELHGLSDAELLPPQAAEQSAAMEEELLERGGVRRFEARRKTPEGERDLMEFKATYADDAGHIAGLIGSLFDITERKVAEKMIRDSHAQLDQIFNTAADGMRLIGLDHEIITVNQTFLAMSGLSADEVVGRKCYEIFPGADCETSHCPLRMIHEGAERVEREALKQRKDGTTLYCLVTATPYRDAEGHLIGIIEDFRDITARKQAEEEIARLAHFDVLTGLPNRALFLDRLERTVVQARRYQRVFALLFLDLDGFKEVNDRHGHEVGDQLLKGVGARLLEVVREADTVGRMGGDEFTVLLVQLNAAGEAAIVAERILAALGRPFTLAGQSITVGASIGIAVFPDDGQDQESLLKQADNAMYAVKAAGKHNYRFSSGGSAAS